MSKLIARLRSWLAGGSAEGRTPVTPDLRLNYRLYWTKLARGWPEARRQQTLQAVNDVIGSDTFDGNPLARRFRVPDLDDSAHAGASLLALRDVLEGLDNYPQQEAQS